MVLAGIVLFNPNLDRLRDNINSIGSQVDKLIFVDNASKNATDIKNLLDTIQFEFVFIDNNRNNGIAYALNQIMKEGESIGSEWVLTLDQDSICPPDLIMKLTKYSTYDNVGIICPIIHDRCLGNLGVRNNGSYQYVDCCITSASLTNVNIWRKVGGFDITMFIDGVDNDYCYTLGENSYKIIQCNEVQLLHEIGHNSKTTCILGHKQVIFNHTPFRYYYICRNIVYLNRKHPAYRPSPLRGILSSLYRALLVCLYESDKLDKVKAIVHGCIDGYRITINKKSCI